MRIEFCDRCGLLMDGGEPPFDQAGAVTTEEGVIFAFSTHLADGSQLHAKCALAVLHDLFERAACLGIEVAFNGKSFVKVGD